MKLTAIIALCLWAMFLIIFLAKAYLRLCRQIRRAEAERVAWEAVHKELQGDIDEN